MVKEYKEWTFEKTLYSKDRVIQDLETQIEKLESSIEHVLGMSKDI